MSTSQPVADTIERLPTASPGQYLGFGLQPIRMCLHLLAAAPGDKVSIEFLDDVAVRRADGTCLVEQAKSGLSHNPVSDWSVDLWKTFANWISAIASGHLDPGRTTFSISVCPAYTGSWVQKFHDARTAAHVAELMAEIGTEIERRGGLPTGCGPYLQTVLGCDPGVRDKIITSFTLIACPDDPVADIRQRLPMVSTALLDDVCRAAIGWVKDATDRLIRAQQPADIEAAAFHSWLGAYLRKHDRDHLLASFAPKPEAANIARELTVRTYVRQLDAIDCSSDDKLCAVSDFLLAASDRTIWSDRGLILEDSLNEFDDGLKRHWSLERQRIALLHTGRPEPEVGKLLYLDVIQHRA